MECCDQSKHYCNRLTSQAICNGWNCNTCCFLFLLHPALNAPRQSLEGGVGLQCGVGSFLNLLQVGCSTSAYLLILIMYVCSYRLLRMNIHEQTAVCAHFHSFTCISVTGLSRQSAQSSSCGVIQAFQMSGLTTLPL